MTRLLSSLLLIICAAFINPAFAANCDKECTGKPECWDQCTKSDDCGSGHKCIETGCGNRCKEDKTT